MIDDRGTYQLGLTLFEVNQGMIDKQTIERCVEQARERAIAAGADAKAIDVVSVDETPLAYMDRPMSQIRAKVAGPPA